ncbi:hypothetical protein FisN_12Lh220 [Fistulifera solaris]|uniref:EF-hand domain-containing protein n=1 Tax=Fistulifera solaris TaxID=1519565 RepID=A0A1Z5JMJ3_FISSO|nr:hypothetical protein FisN_12Lh220 [Fistulifera solaris]|eukprot:GAX15082.1 hypothetical protein FisN_12Lh220 [Fistulifera solaris]
MLLAATTRATRTTIIRQSRALSSQGSDAVEKLRSVLEEYRLQNYAQELPGRFKKDIVRAATVENTDRIAVGGMERVLSNIGATNKISSTEINTIFQELGNGTGEISINRFSSLI